MSTILLQPPRHDFVETVIGLSIWVHCNAHPVRQGDINKAYSVAIGEQARNLLD
jgi:hypothetical protein